MTMFELMIVIFIISVMSMVALPSLMDARDEYRLVAVAGEIVGVMNNARILSVSRNEDMRVNVSATDTYLVQEKDGVNWNTEDSYALPAGYAFTSSGAIIEFHSRGNATPVATLTVANPNGTQRNVVVELSGRSYSVSP